MQPEHEVTQSQENILVKENGEVFEYPLQKLCKEEGVYTIIRIHDDDVEDAYNNLPPEELDHFNLASTTILGMQRSYNPIGVRSLLVRIVGHQDSRPILSLENIKTVFSDHGRRNLTFEELAQEDFVTQFPNSFAHIQSVDELKAAILARYHWLPPYSTLSPEEFLSFGVDHIHLIFSGEKTIRLKP